MSGIDVKIDGTALEKWENELSTRGLRNAIRRAIDQSARFARKITIPAIAADIGVPKARIAAAVPKVITTKAGDLAARWTISKLRIGIGSTTGASVTRAGGLTASTHRVTGGGSASLHVGNAFIVHANGGTFVAYRRGPGRLPLKGIYGETPMTAMAQDGAAARVLWEKTANAEVSRRLSIEVAKQLVAERLGPSTPDIPD